jgi:hypothetical protein
MGATQIMVIRHAEKPGTYDGVQCDGVDPTGTTCGEEAAEHLVTKGWERAGALVTLFAPPWGPKAPLQQPQYLIAANPDPKLAALTPATPPSTPPSTTPPPAASTPDDQGPSQRPYETLTALAARLGIPIHAKHPKKDYDKAVAEAIAQPGVVLICWQHQDIPLLTADKTPGLSQSILTQTGTPPATSAPWQIPSSWPSGPDGARYDLVLVFERPSGDGPITGFQLVAQQLLAGDLPTAP